MNSYTLYVGIDIAAATAAVHWQSPAQAHSQSLTIDQNPAAYQRLIQHLQCLAAPAQTLVVMEATGSYWLGLALYLQQADFAVSVINPVQARHFARMKLQHTKTDALDARLLCDYARMAHPDLWTPPPAVCHRLRQHLERREDVLHMRTQERNRLHALRHDPRADAVLLARLQAHIDQLSQEANWLQQQIETLLQQDGDWAAAAQRLLSIPGIGPITAAWLLVTTHAFARCQTPEQAAAFAGLVPHLQQSGRSLRGRSSICGGHPQLRKMLYMAAGAAIRFNPPLAAFFNRLVARGKRKQLARVAVARKLIHIAWACVVKNRTFDPFFGQQALAA